jgi:hypothetical protein
VVDESLEHDVDEFQPDSPTHGVVVLPASSAHPGEVAERPHSPPSPEDSPAFQIDLTRSQRPSSQRPGQSQPIRKSEWDPRFRREFEAYQRVERALRWQIWEEWTNGERRRAYIYTTNLQLKEEMRVWKQREARGDNMSRQRRPGAASSTSTQGGGVEFNPDL